MNDLDLPPRRTLPTEVRDRIRTTVNETIPRSWTARHRAPLSVAAAVAVVAAGAVIIGQSVAGTPDDFRAGETPPSSTSVTAPPPTYFTEPRPELVPVAPNAQTTQDLDHCGAVVAASPRANEFAPRSSWEPVYTVVHNEVRITAFREYGGKPGFCEIDGTTATVSDPSAEPMQFTMGKSMDIYALYLGSSGLLAGVGQGASYVEFSTLTLDSNGAYARALAVPVLRNDLFVVDVGELTSGSKLIIKGIDRNAEVLLQGEWPFDPAKVRPVGATGQF